MSSDDRLVFVPYLDEDREPIRPDERDFLVEFVRRASELRGKQEIEHATIEQLRRYRDRRGLLQHVPRHWADSLPMHFIPFHRMMDRVERDARSRHDAYEIIREEIRRWQIESPNASYSVTPVKRYVEMASEQGVTIDSYWFNI